MNPNEPEDGRDYSDDEIWPEFYTCGFAAVNKGKHLMSEDGTHCIVCQPVTIK